MVKTTMKAQTIAERFIGLLISVVGLMSGGKIIPDKTFPITLSSTNAGDRAEYNFTMTTQSELIPGCKIEIHFPEQQYINGLGLDYNFQAYYPYGKSIPAEVDEKKLLLEPGYVQAGKSFTLTIEGIQNPFKMGGTGLFKAYHVCGTGSPIVYVAVDVCEDYSTIAVTQPKIKLLQTHVNVEPGSSNVAGEKSNYLIFIQPTTELNRNTVFRITFPDFYNFTYLKEQVTDFPSDNPCEITKDNTTQFMLSGNITCRFSDVQDNVLEWVGNNKTIPKNSNIWLRLAGLYNPAREMKTEFIKIDLVLKNTNFTYEYFDSVEGLEIEPGPINNFILKPVLDVPLVSLSDYDFTISLKPANEFNSLRVVTRFRKIEYCIIRNALIPDNKENKVVCEINSNVLDVRNIKEYKRRWKENLDRIDILVRGKTPLSAGVQLPFEVYTYLNNDHTIKVDQNLTSLKTSMFLTTSPPSQANTVLSFSSTGPDAANIFTADIAPLANYTAQSYEATIKIVFSPLFQFGVTQLEPIRCHYRQSHQWRSSYFDSEGVENFIIHDNIVDKYVDCGPDASSASVLTIPLKTGDVWYPIVTKAGTALVVENTLTITNLKNPSVFDIYDVDMLLYLNGSDKPVEKKRIVLTITAPPFTVTINSFITTRGMSNLLEFKFDAPLALDRGNRNLDNFYDQFSHVIIRFPQKEGASNAWDGRLDYLTPDLSFIPCWASDDMKTYRGALKCQMKYGKTSGTTSSSDYPIITIYNYKKMASTERVNIAFIVNNPTVAVAPKVEIDVIKILSNREYIIASNVITLAGTTAAAGGAYPGGSFTTVVSVAQVQTSADIQIDFNLVAAYVANDNVYFMIQLPASWQFSTSLFQPTTIFHEYIKTGIPKVDQMFTGKYYYDDIMKRLIVIPRDDVTTGAHTLKINRIIGPNGAKAANNIEVSMYASGAQVYTEVGALGAVNAHTISAVTLTTNIDLENADGVVYKFEWTNEKNYEGEPVFEIGFEDNGVPVYAFGANHKCELYINDVLQREDWSTYKQNCLYAQTMAYPVLVGPSSLTAFTMSLKKNIPKNTKIAVLVYYMKHPAASFAGNFHLAVRSFITNPYDVNEPPAKEEFLTSYKAIPVPAGFLTTGSPKDALIEAIWGFPLNMEEAQSLYFDFHFKTYLPKGTQIDIILPMRYSQLADRVTSECYLIGDVMLLESCGNTNDLAKRSIVITLGEDYIADTKLTLQYVGYALFEYNIADPPTFDNVTENEIGDFKIEAVYNSFMWAKTGVADYKKLRVYDKIIDSMVFPEPQLLFYPTNEAERATYNITLEMNQLVDFWEGDKIWIRFPLRYDVHLSKGVINILSHELQGALNFSVYNREMTIWGFYPGRIPNKVTLSINGITNPNNNANIPITGFTIALLNQLNMTRGIFKNFGNLFLSDPPDIIELISIDHTIQYARYDDNYTLELNTYIPFPDSKTGAKLLVEFPADFIVDIFYAKCSTNEKFSLYSTCSNLYNTYEISSANEEYNTQEEGSISLKINGIRNAEYAGLTGPVIVYNYDTTTSRVLSRSFGTLSKSYLDFSLDGLELMVFDGKPYYLEVGSFSDPIKIGPVETMKQRLTVIPLYFDSNFLFDKTPSILIPETAGSFINLAAPQDMLIKRFYITWIKSGDSQKKFYAPIAKMPVYVVKVVNKRKVGIASTFYANLGGLSIPLEITTTNPPYDDIAVSFVVQGAQAAKITLNQTSVTITKGVYLIRYRVETIDATYTDPSIIIQCSISGTDSPSFEFLTPAATVTIPIQPEDLTPAGFEDLSISNNKRGRAEVYVKTNKLAYVYCVTGYKHMPEPTFAETKANTLGPNYSYSKPIYTWFWTKRVGSGFSNTFWIEGLTPGTEYTAYCYTMNLNRIPSTTFKKLDFKNKAAQKIATFTMKVNQPLVTQTLRDEYVKRLATIMGIRSHRVIEKMNCISDPKVGSDLGSTYITYYVLPDPKNEDIDLSPINLVRNLNRQRNDIKKFIPKLDDDTLLVMEEVKKREPFFKNRPVMTGAGFHELEISVEMTTCGYLIVAAQKIDGTRWLDATNTTMFFYEKELVKNNYSPNTQFYPYGIDNAKDEKIEFNKYGGDAYKPTVSIDQGVPIRRRMLKVLQYTDLTTIERFPSAFQMYNLLNEGNLPEAHLAKIPVNNYNDVIKVKIDGLQDNLIYNVYVALVNDLPSYPDYLNKDYIAQVNVKTLKKRRRLIIYSINTAKLMSGLLAIGFALINLLIF